MLFTDIEGSTRLLERLGRERYAEALELHRGLLQAASDAHDGYVVDNEGDAFFVAFATAEDGVAAAAEAQRALAAAEWPEGQELHVRMGIHTGEPLATPPKYVGLDVHRAARIMAAGHGGQVLISETTRTLLDAHVEARDLGAHRLKDLSAAQRLYQLQFDGAVVEFPPLRSLNQSNLPVQPTPLIGREAELREVLDHLRVVRMLTLTGAGGSGKTRLALQAAAELTDEFLDGVWFVSLAGVADASLFLQAVGAALGAGDDLREFLHSRRLLLVLDNLEHLLPDVAPLVAGFLDAPRVKVLATSRERVAVSAEHEYVVPPLVFDEAVALFIERARQLKPSFERDEHVGVIVLELEGLPLAVELAAARVKVLTSKQIRERLTAALELLRGGARDAPKRQQTLRATIQWSFDLLGEEEQDLFGRLAVFPSSFDLDAAEQVVDAGLDALGSLIDKSLLRQTTEGRFFMLDTLRQFARELLAQRADRAEMHRRHAEAALERAARSDEESLALWIGRIDRDYQDFRAALIWLRDQQEGVLLLSLASKLARYWDQRHLQEGRLWLEAALARAPAMVTSEKAEVLLRLGHIALRQGDFAAATLNVEAADAAAAELGDQQKVAWLHMIRGAIAYFESRDYARARREYESALGFFRAADAKRDVAIALHDMGLQAFDAGENADARRLIEESLEIARGLGDRDVEANAAGSLGTLELEEGDLERARALLIESLRLEQLVTATDFAISNTLVTIAMLAATAGKSQTACLLIGARDAYLERTGAVAEPLIESIRTRALSQAAKDSGTELAEQWRSEGKEMALAAAVEQALDLDDFLRASS